MACLYGQTDVARVLLVGVGEGSYGQWVGHLYRKPAMKCNALPRAHIVCDRDQPSPNQAWSLVGDVWLVQVEGGADPNLTDPLGRTPKQIARNSGHTGCLELMEVSHWPEPHDGGASGFERGANGHVSFFGGGEGKGGYASVASWDG